VNHTALALTAGAAVLAVVVGGTTAAPGLGGPGSCTDTCDGTAAQDQVQQRGQIRDRVWLRDGSATGAGDAVVLAELDRDRDRDRLRDGTCDGDPDRDRVRERDGRVDVLAASAGDGDQTSNTAGARVRIQAQTQAQAQTQTQTQAQTQEQARTRAGDREQPQMQPSSEALVGAGPTATPGAAPGGPGSRG
jgi:hypothetical protein